MIPGRMKRSLFTYTHAGCHGGGTIEFWYASSTGDADCLRCVYDFTGGRSHAGTDDIYVHTAQHRSGLQLAQYQSCARITTWASALVYRGRMGLLHIAGTPSVSSGNCDTLLGEVLWLLSSSRLVGLHCADTGANNLPRVRDTLLS